MNTPQVKRAIRNLIVAHQSVLRWGGTYEHSNACHTLDRRKVILLSMLKLPATDENLRAIFTYPLSHPANPESLMCEARCQCKRFITGESPWEHHRGLWTTLLTYNGKLIDHQVEFVFDRLMKLVEQHKNI